MTNIVIIHRAISRMRQNVYLRPSIQLQNMNDLQLFRASQAKHASILALWEDAVRATHDFLSEEDLQFYKQELQAKYLHAVDLFCLQSSKGELLAFMGLHKLSLEMLFVHPAYHRRGLGSALVQTARQSFGISQVSVNEQNQQAVNFYTKCGFEIIGREELDASGRPYPILHLEISSSQAAAFVDWNNYAESWEDTLGVKDFAQQCFLDLTSRINLLGLRVLDFGCGTGLLSAMLHQAGAQVVAVDSSEEMIKQLNDKSLAGVHSLVCELKAADIAQQELLQKPFDLIVASSVLAFVAEQEETLSRLQSLLRQGGQLLQWDWLKVNNQADFGFQMAELRTLYNKVGLPLLSLGESFTVKSENGSFAALLAHAQKN